MIVTLEQMKGAVGSLLFLWSQIERELADSIRELHNNHLPKTAHGIGRSIELWSNEIQRRAAQRILVENTRNLLVSHLWEALTVRNFVCHGLIGITAQISPDDKEAHLTVEINDEKRVLSWSELEEMFRWMARARWLIRDLTTVVLDPDPVRCEELLHGWKDFPRRG